MVFLDFKINIVCVIHVTIQAIQQTTIRLSPFFPIVQIFAEIRSHGTNRRRRDLGSLCALISSPERPIRVIPHTDAPPLILHAQLAKKLP